jgi:hypothetical protein
MTMAAQAQAPEQLGKISGIVQDSTRVPLAGVTVTAMGPGGMATIRTDAAGSYSLSAPRGVYRVTATHARFISSTFNHVDVGSAPDVRANFTLEPLVAAPAPSSPARPDRDVMISADRQAMQGEFILYRGNVRMTTSGMVLYADELDFNTVTRSASARGNVTMRVIPAPPR